jgi:hypothetical protein
MLEGHQDRLVRGLQELYRRLLKVGAWDVLPLAETDGKPLTHDILRALGLLHEGNDGSGDPAPFEGDFQRLRLSLGTEMKDRVHRQESVSSELNCGLHVLAGSNSYYESTGSKPTSPTRRIGTASTIPSSPTRIKIPPSRVPDLHRGQPPIIPSLHHLSQCANDQRSGALEPTQKVDDLDDSLQATISSLAKLTPDWDDDMGCVKDFQWDQIQSFDDVIFDIYAPYSSLWGADAFTSGLQDIADI